MRERICVPHSWRSLLLQTGPSGPGADTPDELPVGRSARSPAVGLGEFQRATSDRSMRGDKPKMQRRAKISERGQEATQRTTPMHSATASRSVMGGPLRSQNRPTARAENGPLNVVPACFCGRFTTKLYARKESRKCRIALSHCSPVQFREHMLEYEHRCVNYIAKMRRNCK